MGRNSSNFCVGFLENLKQQKVILRLTDLYQCKFVVCYLTFCINWRVKKYIWRILTLILTFTASATAASAASPNHQQQLYAGSSTLGNSLGHYASLGGSRSAATSPVGGASGTYLQSGDYLVFFMVAMGALATDKSRFKKLWFKKEYWFKKDCCYNQNFSTYLSCLIQEIQVILVYVFTLLLSKLLSGIDFPPFLPHSIEYTQYCRSTVLSIPIL